MDWALCLAILTVKCECWTAAWRELLGVAVAVISRDGLASWFPISSGSRFGSCVALSGYGEPGAWYRDYIVLRETWVFASI